MPRVSPRLIQYGLLCALIWAVGCPSTFPPQMSVSNLAFNFLPPSLPGPETDVFNISNTGGGTLNWTITSSPSWLTAAPLSGSLAHNALQAVTMTIDRTGLTAGIHSGQVVITSNGGNQNVAVSVTVVGPPTPVLSVNPSSLDFGSTDLDRGFTIRNTGTGTLNWTAASDQTWLTLSATSGTTSSETDAITATIDRSTLSGSPTATITITSDGGNATIAVTVTVAGAIPVLSVAPLSLDFGAQTTTSTFTISNTGTGTLNWTLTESLSWLSVSSATGATTTTPATITVTVDRTGLGAGPLAGALSITSNGGAATVNVTASVAATQMVVSPLTLNFGSFATNKLFTITNAGTGTVNWTANTAGLPPWLSVAAPTSGSITTTAHGVLVSANRTGLAPGNYTHDLSVTSSPNVGSATVSVTMTVAVTPVLTIETGQVSADERPLVPLGDRDTTLTFTIRNTGTGSLDWNIDPAEFPSWLAMAPVAGSLTTQTDTVTVTVDRTDLAVGAYKQDVPVTSNGGNAIIEVSMVVPLRASIGTDADELDFGLLASVGSFGVANYGDPGTILNFTVSSDKVWLFNSPSTGNSIGVASPPPFKDYRTISVSVDRGSLESRGSTGTFTIQAVDGTGAVITDIAPKQVLVSVEAAPLSFELANARTRIPSLVQFAFIMRDFRNRAIFATPADLANSFQIIENGVSLETTETNQFVTSGANLRTNMVIMLDFSGSVYDAAQGLGLPGTDQLHAAYEQTVSDFIDGIPAQYRVALMEFHDRSQATRLVRDFTEDKTALKTALHDIAISDHGASPILPAVDDAAGRLRDVDAQLLSFDNADVRALVMVSDGRLTTPPGIMQDTVDLAVLNRMRIFSIGWGKDVNNEPLARLAVSSGGHYYATRGDANGDPTVAELDQKLQTILSDLSSQMVLTYVTLNETERVPARVNAQVNDPNDSPDEGLLQGTFAQDLKLSEIAGDVKMGQISMRSSGVAGGAATVTLRLDYAPRNVNKFRFTLTSAEAFDPPALVTAADGGATDGWTLTPLGGGVYTLTAPAPTDVLQYGAFGNLLTLTFPAVGATPFTVALTVDNTIYSADPEPKYFVYPDTITVGADGSIAPAFPTALIAPASIAFRTALNSQALTVQNIGGSYPYGVTPSSVQLNWEVQSNPTFVSVDPADGSRNTTVGADTVTVTADRTGDPGFYSGTIVFVYTGNTLAIANSIQIPITMQITNPALSVSSNLIDFGAVSTSDTLTITNSGQSTLNWQFSTAAFPTWLTATPSSGVTTSETDSIGLTVDRTGLTGGAPYTYTISITSNGGTQNITVNVTG